MYRSANVRVAQNVNPSLCFPFPGADPNVLGADNQQPIKTLTADNFLCISEYSRIDESTIRQMMEGYIEYAPDIIEQTIEATQNKIPEFIYQPIKTACEERLDRLALELSADHLVSKESDILSDEDNDEEENAPKSELGF